MTMREGKAKAVFLTPAGAGMAMICFFLPWIRVSCMGADSYAGSDFGGIYWLVFAMAGVILAAFFILRWLKRLGLLRVVASGALIVTIAVIVYGYISIAGGKRFLLVKVGPDDVDLRLQIGGYGMILGYLLAIAGSWLAKVKARSDSDSS